MMIISVFGNGHHYYKLLVMVIITKKLMSMYHFRFWYGQGKRVCWETVIKALLRIGEKASAGKLTEKYKL